MIPRQWWRRFRWAGDSSVVMSASQLDGCVSDSPPLSESPSAPWLGSCASTAR